MGRPLYFGAWQTFTYCLNSPLWRTSEALCGLDWVFCLFPWPSTLATCWLTGDCFVCLGFGPWQFTTGLETGSDCLSSEEGYISEKPQMLRTCHMEISWRISGWTWTQTWNFTFHRHAESWSWFYDLFVWRRMGLSFNSELRFVLFLNLETASSPAKFTWL